MSDAGVSANAARGSDVRFGSEPAAGLNDGDVVAFLDPDSGKPYAVRREEDPEGRGDAVFLFRVDLDAAEASVATARTLERLRNNEDAHLEVQKHGDFVGFRAAGANGKLLQATRKGACRRGSMLALQSRRRPGPLSPAKTQSGRQRSTG